MGFDIALRNGFGFDLSLSPTVLGVGETETGEQHLLSMRYFELLLPLLSFRLMFIKNLGDVPEGFYDE
jgi:hypothetical protein